MEINIKWNICRVCLTEEEKKPPTGACVSMRHIFDEDEQLAQQIYECSGITMKKKDNLPEKICKKCLFMIKCAVNFRTTCRASDTYLQSILQCTKSATNIFKQDQSKEFLQEISNDSINYDNIESVGTKSVMVGLNAINKSETLQIQDTLAYNLDNDTNSPELNTKADNLIEHDVEENINENGVNCIVTEEEEILEHSDSCANRLLSTTKDVAYMEKEIIDDHIENEAALKPEALYMKYIQINEEVAGEDEDFVIDGETDLHEFKENSKQQSPERDTFYEQENEDEQSILQESDSQREMLQNSIDYQTVESSEIIEKDNEDEYDIMELQEEHSRLSSEENDMQPEYIIDEYFTNENSSDIITKNSKRKTNNTKLPKSKKRCESELWVCDLCGNHFNNRILLNAHIKVHRQEKNHECELCSKRFITACNLQAHMRIHTGEKPFECQYCGRRFSDRSSNLRHERTHTNEKPFQCKECGKAFSLGTTLKKHLKVHTGERLYRCDICAKSFKLIHQLKAHKNTALHKAIEQLVQQEQ